MQAGPGDRARPLMTHRHYTWLLLDADGTLFDYDRSEATALERTFADVGQAIDGRTVGIYRSINSSLWRNFEMGRVTPDEIKVQRFEHLFQAIGIAGDPAEFSRAYLRHLAEAADLLDGAEAALQALHGRVGLALITNGLQAVQRSRLMRSGIVSYLEAIIISEEVGFSKPHPGIFDIAFRRMNQPAKAEVLMVGDSPSSDILGGNRYGIDTCWFNPTQRPRPDGMVVDYEISRLEALLEIVGL